VLLMWVSTLTDDEIEDCTVRSWWGKEGKNRDCKKQLLLPSKLKTNSVYFQWCTFASNERKLPVRNCNEWCFFSHA
jgi:hypothetical protein